MKYLPTSGHATPDPEPDTVELLAELLEPVGTRSYEYNGRSVWPSASAFVEKCGQLHACIESLSWWQRRRLRKLCVQKTLAKAREWMKEKS